MVKHLYLDVGDKNNSEWKVISIQKYNEEKHKFQEIVPFYSARYQLEKQKERIKKKNNFKEKVKRIIKILKE